MCQTEEITRIFTEARAAQGMWEGAGGSMVFVSSASGRSAVVNIAAKAGTAGLAHVGPAPNGRIAACASTASRPAEDAARLVPMPRVARLEEIAGAIAFPIYDAASHITGQEHVVDGGMTISRIIGRKSATV